MNNSHVDNLQSRVRELEAQLQLQLQPNAARQQGQAISPPDSSHSQPVLHQEFPAKDDPPTRVDVYRPTPEQMNPQTETAATLNNESCEQRYQPLGEGEYTLTDGGEKTSNPADVNDSSEITDHMPATDGMVEYSNPSSTGKDTAEFYGDSYSLQFAMHVKASTMPMKMSLSTMVQPHSGLEISSKTRQQPSQPQDSEADLAALRSYLTAPSLQDLPHRHVAKQLLECYFSDVHPIWPLLIEDETRLEFERTYISEDPVEPISIAKLNMIFALGSQFSSSFARSGDPVGGIHEAGTVFYRRARAFTVANSFDLCSIGMLQVLLLMAQYQQGTMRGKQCWLTIGHATRIAECLGLHLDSQGASLSPLDRELGRRLWWGCFSLDRYVALLTSLNLDF
jgi:hypothetical protein